MEQGRRPPESTRRFRATVHPSARRVRLIGRGCWVLRRLGCCHPVEPPGNETARPRRGFSLFGGVGAVSTDASREVHREPV